MWAWLFKWEEDLKKDWASFEARLAAVEAKTAEVIAKDVHEALQVAHSEILRSYQDLTVEYGKVKNELELWKNKVLNAVADTVQKAASDSVGAIAVSPVQPSITEAPPAA